MAATHTSARPPRRTTRLSESSYIAATAVMFSKVQSLVAVAASIAAVAVQASAQLAEGYYTITPVDPSTGSGARLLAGSFFSDGRGSTPAEGLPPIRTYDQVCSTCSRELTWLILFAARHRMGSPDHRHRVLLHHSSSWRHRD